MRLTQIVEALLFASDAPLSAGDIARIDERLDEDTVEAVIQELRGEYEETERAFQIYELAGGYQLLTRPDYATYLERYETVPQPAKLSAPALETLAIIAYRQPIGRGEIEDIRGVGSSSALKTLQDRGLVEVVARGEGLGRPLLYGTTSKFLEHFGFRSTEDLPRPEELPVVLRAQAVAREAGPIDSPIADIGTPDLPSETEASVALAADQTEEAAGVLEPVPSLDANGGQPGDAGE
ncbi:MAG TPA: SMC-Scp complex subunit ScpB [Longimicrobiales bacterium]|nr:SMC-Scp complex subunit ScpB [Longimicrobiales bacterium]